LAAVLALIATLLLSDFPSAAGGVGQYDPLDVEQNLAGDGSADDLFGFQVATSGDYVVASAYLDDNPAGLDAGYSYVLARSCR